MFRSKRPRDMLNEIKWRFDLSKCLVYYIHRGAPGDIKIVEGSTIKSIDRSFLILEGFVNDVYIPYHRIFRIDYGGLPVYARKSLQNSGIQNTTLQNKNQNI
ncbi:MAG: RNA repair domain-containing protein [Candidatus Methanoperedens sp.]|nr:RNA repair domain-containing protein [Candidatus Methanoperedens sp.]